MTALPPEDRLLAPQVDQDMLALLDYAITVRRLERWLRGAEFRFVTASEVVGEGEITVGLDHDVLCGEVQSIARVAGPDLLAAIGAALDKAGAP